MDDLTPRLVKCFKIVFPSLSSTEIESASQSSLESWDSVATVTLANVIEEEFSVEMDFDRLAELDSFATVRQWVETETQAA